jgi:hypothetical protein
MYGFTESEVTRLLEKFPKPEDNMPQNAEKVLGIVNTVLDEVEKVNSVSPVGTLEFLDSLTKYSFDHPAWTNTCNPDKSSYMSLGVTTKTQHAPVAVARNTRSSSSRGVTVARNIRTTDIRGRKK